MSGFEITWDCEPLTSFYFTGGVRVEILDDERVRVSDQDGHEITLTKELVRYVSDFVGRP